MMSEATVERKATRGFGFIRTRDSLLSYSPAVDGMSDEQLREGQRVSDVETKGDQGPRAGNVQPL